MKYLNELHSLIEAGYLIENSETKVISLSPLGYTLLQKPQPDASTYIGTGAVKAAELTKRIEQLSVKYLALWPAKIQSGGRAVKQGPSAIKAKLKTFLKKFPKYTDEQILKATAAYVAKFKQKNYEYITCSDYFISKDNVSQLEALIEQGTGTSEIVVRPLTERVYNG